MPEAYEVICGEVKLCPRLVPSPLWYISLASLARLDPRLLRVLVRLGRLEQRRYREAVEALDQLNKLWFSWPKRQRECAICGSAPARHLDEDWRYYVSGKQGEAVLEDVKPVCENCHLAKHLGYAQVTGRFDRALRWLARINNLTEREAQNLARRVFNVWESLSRIESWTIKLEYLRREKLMCDEHVEALEDLMNTLVNTNRESYIDGGVVFEDKIRIVNPYSCLIKLRSIYKSSDIIKLLLKEYLEDAVDRLLEKFEEFGIQVNVEELESLLQIVQDKLKTIERIEENMIRIVETSKEICEKKSWSKKLLEEYGLHSLCEFIEANIEPLLSGRWVLMVDVEALPDVLADLVKVMRNDHLKVYSVVTLREREERRDRPIILEVPSLLDVEYVHETIEMLFDIVSKYSTRRRTLVAYFRPQLITKSKVNLFTYSPG